MEIAVVSTTITRFKNFLFFLLYQTEKVPDESLCLTFITVLI